MRLKDGVELWPQQRLMVDYANQRPYSWWLAGCGLGKTLAALTLASEIEARNTLIITLKNLIEPVWVDEAHKYMTEFWMFPLNKKSSKHKAKIIHDVLTQKTDDSKLFIVNYETARLLPLEKYNWDFVFCDESHRLKSYNSAISNDLAAKLAHVPVKVIGTGTGWEDRPTDVFGQVRFLDMVPGVGRGYARSKVFGAWTRFFDRYVNYDTQDNIPIPRSYKNIDEIASKIKPFTLQLQREDFLDLPNSQDIPLWFDLPNNVMKRYRELEREAITEFPNLYDDDVVVADNVLVKMLRLHQITGGFYQPYDSQRDIEFIKGGDTKAQLLKDLVETFGDEPFIVYTRFKKDIALIRQILPHTLSELTGDTNTLDGWLKGHTQGLLANIEAGNAGLNLTRARYVVYYSIGFSRTSYVQSRFRIDRPGQTRKMVFYHLLANHTVDKKIFNGIIDKGKTADQITKGL